MTRAELEKLGLGHLVGTPLLRAFMHGFFLHNRLWNKARAVAQPFAYDDYRQQRIDKKLEADRKSRIGLVRKLPKVPLPRHHVISHVPQLPTGNSWLQRYHYA